MALQDPESKSVLAEDKKTGFTYKDKEIVLSKTRGRPMNVGKGMYGVSDEKRIEAATLYAVLGHIAKVAELTGLHETTIRAWRKEEWFVKLLDEIRNENNDKIDVKFTETIAKSIDLISKRLDDGDPYVTKSGEIINVPVKIRDLALVAAINIDKRQILRNKPTAITQQQATPVLDKLDQLAQAFTALANKKEIVVPQTIEDVEYEDVVESNGEKQTNP